MAFIQENLINIQLNLKKTYTLVHFSDVHIVAFPNDIDSKEYAQANEHESAWYRVRKDFANYFKETCTEEQMIPSIDCLKKLLAYTTSIHPNLLMMSGDILDYDSQSNIDFLTKELNQIDYPFVLSCGNHEHPDIFSQLTNHQETFMVKNLKEFKVISVDNSTKKFSKKQVELLKKELGDNLPILLCMHIPLMTKNNQEEMKKYDSYYIIDHQNCDVSTKEFIDLILSAPQIKHVFCGHTHGKGCSSLIANKNQYCASSGLIGYVNKIMIH